MNADHVTLIVRRHGTQFGPEGSSRLLSQLAEVGKGRLAALVVAGEGTSSRCVPRGTLVEDLGKRLHVARVEGLVTTADQVCVFTSSHVSSYLPLSVSLRPYTPSAADGALSSDCSRANGERHSKSSASVQSSASRAERYAAESPPARDLRSEQESS